MPEQVPYPFLFTLEINIYIKLTKLYHGKQSFGQNTIVATVIEMKQNDSESFQGHPILIWFYSGGKWYISIFKVYNFILNQCFLLTFCCYMYSEVPVIHSQSASHRVFWQ